AEADRHLVVARRDLGAGGFVLVVARTVRVAAARALVPLGAQVPRHAVDAGVHRSAERAHEKALGVAYLDRRPRRLLAFGGRLRAFRGSGVSGRLPASCGVALVLPSPLLLRVGMRQVVAGERERDQRAVRPGRAAELA